MRQYSSPVIRSALAHAHRCWPAACRYSGQLLRHAENVLDAVLPVVREGAETTNGIPPVQHLVCEVSSACAQ